MVVRPSQGAAVGDGGGRFLFRISNVQFRIYWPLRASLRGTKQSLWIGCRNISHEYSIPFAYAAYSRQLSVGDGGGRSNDFIKSISHPLQIFVLVLTPYRLVYPSIKLRLPTLAHDRLLSYRKTPFRQLLKYIFSFLVFFAAPD